MAGMDALLDRRQLGRLIRGHRYMLGMDNGQDFVERMEKDTGVSLSDRSLYAYERGTRTPTIDTWMALAIELDLTAEDLVGCIEDDILKRRALKSFTC